MDRGKLLFNRAQR
jgi:hypothetical protein